MKVAMVLLALVFIGGGLWVMFVGIDKDADELEKRKWFRVKWRRK